MYCRSTDLRAQSCGRQQFCSQSSLFHVLIVIIIVIMTIRLWAIKQQCSLDLFPSPVPSRVTRNLSLGRFRYASSTTKPVYLNRDKESEDNNVIQRPYFYVPKSERGEKRSMYDMCYTVGETRLARNSRTCPTRELYFVHSQWHLHKSPYRKFRHMANLFLSAPFQRLLFPDLFCVAICSGGLTYYNEFLAHVSENFDILSIPPTAFAGATTAIGLLAGFRLNSSVGRVQEGRKAWSVINNTTRDFSRQIMMWIDKAAQTRMLRLCQAFPVALMFSINDKGCHHNMKRNSKTGEGTFKERIDAEFKAEMYDVYSSSFADEKISNDILRNDFERLCRLKSRGENVPLEVLTCMSETIAACDGKVNPIYIREMDSQIQRLSHALGSSERIVKTPLPTGFTRHSSRLLFIWSNCLPLALYPMLGPIGTLPASLLTAWAVLGIEDISVQLEEPFDILPLRQYSDGIYDSIAAIEKNYNSYSSSVSICHKE